MIFLSRSRRRSRLRRKADRASAGGHHQDAQRHAAGEQVELAGTAPALGITTVPGNTRPYEDLTGIGEAAAIINAAERPLSWLDRVQLAGAEQGVIKLAERPDSDGVPLLGLCRPADHPMCIGMLGMHGNLAPNLLTNQADVIIAIGMRFDDRSPDAWTRTRAMQRSSTSI